MINSLRVKHFLFFLFVGVELSYTGASALADEAHIMMIFGDSITASSNLPKVDLDRLWVNQLQKAAGDSLKIINEGKGGRSTNSVSEFQEALRRNPHVDTLIIALGMNDSRDVSDQCIPMAIKNIQTMIEASRVAYGPSLSILIFGPTNINRGALGPSKPIGDQREQKLKDLNTAFEALAKQLNCDYVSLLGIIPASSLLKDGVHPDVTGNDAIFSVVSKKLLSVNSP